MTDTSKDEKQQKNIYKDKKYPYVNGTIMAETTSHLLIDATYNGTKGGIESDLKFIVRKKDGYWMKLGWNHPMNNPDIYEEGDDLIKYFVREYNRPMEYYFYVFYGRRGSESSRLQEHENPLIEEITEKRFSSKKEMAEFLSLYKDEQFTFKDIGINNTHGGDIISAHSCEELIEKLKKEYCTSLKKN